VNSYWDKLFTNLDIPKFHKLRYIRTPFVSEGVDKMRKSDNLYCVKLKPKFEAALTPFGCQMRLSRVTSRVIPFEIALR
jgi:hypothetical protein